MNTKQLANAIVTLARRAAADSFTSSKDGNIALRETLQKFDALVKAEADSHQLKKVWTSSMRKFMKKTSDTVNWEKMSLLLLAYASLLEPVQAKCSDISTADMVWLIRHDESALFRIAAGFTVATATQSRWHTWYELRKQGLIEPFKKNNVGLYKLTKFGWKIATKIMERL
jgi:hypothetical protein